MIIIYIVTYLLMGAGVVNLKSNTGEDFSILMTLIFWPFQLAWNSLELIGMILYTMIMPR